MDATQKIFTSYDIQACLYDAERVEYFKAAICTMIRPGDVVIDAGSGTGILGLFAAQAGAARVYCLEINEGYVKVIQENAKRNKLDQVIVAIHADASTYRPAEPIDAIISDVISAGFLYEPQLQILNNLNAFLKPNGTTVPVTMRNYVELIHAQEDLYGLTFSYDTRYRQLPGDRPLTDRVQFLDTTFRNVNSTSVAATVRLTATAAQLANAIRISYAVEFEPGRWVSGPTEFLLNPQIIFLPEPVLLAAGQRYDLSLSYEASTAPADCGIELAKAKADP